MKKRLLSLIALTVFAAGSLFAADATVTFVKGKVEVNRNGEWQTLEVGDVVHQKEVISTGFQSEAKLKYNGNYMALTALTRASIEEMSSTGDTEKVSVALTTGALRSKVTHPEGTRVNYQVKSPVAVASVRGTDFVAMATGRHFCTDGVVAVTAARNIMPILSDVEPAVDESEYDEESLPGEYESNRSEGTDTDTNTNTSTENTNASGTIVIGAHQKTEFNTNGNPEKPIDNASKTITAASKAVQTAAETEAVVAGGSTTSLGGSSKTADVTSLVITIDFAD